MSTEFLILTGLIVVVGVVLYLKKHPLQQLAPAATPEAPPHVDHVGVITAAMQGAAQVVSSLPKPVDPPSDPAPNPLAAYGLGQAQRYGPNGFPLDAAGREINPNAPAGDYSGNDLWRKGSVWRCQLNSGGSDSRSFTVPEGWTGVAEYYGDNAAQQGDFAITIDGQPVVGAGQTIGLGGGAHTITATCVPQLSVGRTFAIANLSINHNP